MPHLVAVNEPEAIGVFAGSDVEMSEEGSVGETDNREAKERVKVEREALKSACVQAGEHTDEAGVEERWEIAAAGP
ncbi:hypothetical protein I204_08536 [Kwoniella mangroviensis CBS 8886]|nr:hypothetical protein I204_08536 [Kwoniella mangroviensis CBS 8886]